MKYLLLCIEIGSVLLYLGMSGVLCVLLLDMFVNMYDYVDIVIDVVLNKLVCVLCFIDLCCFGCLLW